MAAGDVYQLALRASWNGEQIVNTFAIALLTGTAPAASDFQTLATAIKDLLRVDQADDMAYTDWVAHQLRGAGTTYNTTAPFRVSTVSFAGAFTGTLTGARTDPPAPPNVAVVMAILTSMSGRRYKGRIFMGALASSTLNTDGTIDNTARATIQTNTANAIITLCGPSGTNAFAKLGVWSDRIATNTALSATWPRVRTTQGAPDPANAFADAQSILVRDYIGSQRGRRPGF